MLVCGNGGSSADSGHIVGELMKSFIIPRPINENDKRKISEILGESETANCLQEGIPPTILPTSSAGIKLSKTKVKSKEYAPTKQVGAYFKIC